MQITAGKILSLLLAAAYIVDMIANAHGVSANIAKACIALLLPLALIWFPQQLGSFTGYIGRGGNIDVETPPTFISIMGWFFLVGLPVLVHFLT